MVFEGFAAINALASVSAYPSAIWAGNASIQAVAVFTGNGQIIGEEWVDVVPQTDTWSGVTTSSDIWTAVASDSDTWTPVTESSNTWTQQSAGSNTWTRQ